MVTIERVFYGGKNMNELKNAEYLQEIVNICFSKDMAIDIIQNISYLLQDNGYADARYFTDRLMEIIEEEL